MQNAHPADSCEELQNDRTFLCPARIAIQHIAEFDEEVFRLEHMLWHDRLDVIGIVDSRHDIQFSSAVRRIAWNYHRRLQSNQDSPAIKKSYFRKLFSYSREFFTRAYHARRHLAVLSSFMFLMSLLWRGD